MPQAKNITKNQADAKRCAAYLIVMHPNIGSKMKIEISLDDQIESEEVLKIYKANKWSSAYESEIH